MQRGDIVDRESNCPEIRVSDYPAAEDAEGDPEVTQYSVSLDFRWARGEDAGEPVPDMLVCARELLAAVVRAAMAEGYRVRFDAARSVAASAVTTTDDAQARAALARLAERASAGEGVHPVSIWLIPPGGNDVESRIEAFRARRFDDALYDSLLEDGVVRVSVSEEFGDLAARLSLAPVVRQWVRRAIGEPASLARWI
jgi:hypothetical protein